MNERKAATAGLQIDHCGGHRVDDKGRISIPRVDTAIDCGFCVHLERVHPQIEGAAVMGLTLAKHILKGRWPKPLPWPFAGHEIGG